jgi:hypothetical protein
MPNDGNVWRANDATTRGGCEVATWAPTTAALAPLANERIGLRLAEACSVAP